jgi:hypothetical protein
VTEKPIWSQGIWRIVVLDEDSSPLATFLSGGLSSQMKKKKAYRQKIATAAALALFLPAMNSTLASSISLGSDHIEFGQGSNTASACDSSINVEVNTAWSPAPDSFFKVSDFTLTGLDTSAGACYGKTLTLRAFNSSNQELDLNSTATGNALTYTVSNSTGTSVSVQLPVSGSVNSADVAKVTIQTS